MQDTTSNACVLNCIYNILIRLKSLNKINIKKTIPNYPMELLLDSSSTSLFFNVQSKYKKIFPDKKELEELREILNLDEEIEDLDLGDEKVRECIESKFIELRRLFNKSNIDTNDSELLNKIDSLSVFVDKYEDILEDIINNISGIKYQLKEGPNQFIGGVPALQIKEIIDGYIDDFNANKRLNPITKLHDPIKNKISKVIKKTQSDTKRLNFINDLIDARGGVAILNHGVEILSEFGIEYEHINSPKVTWEKLENYFAIIAHSGGHAVSFIRLEDNNWIKTDGYSDILSKPMNLKTLFEKYPPITQTIVCKY